MDIVGRVTESAMYQLADRMVDELARIDPAYAHSLGVANDHIPGYSPADTVAHLGALTELRAELAQTPLEGPADEVAATVAAGELERYLTAVHSGATLTNLNTIVSPWQNCRESLGYFTPLPDRDVPAQLAHYLSGLPGALGGYRETLAEGLAAGKVVSRRTVVACIEQGRQAAGPDSSIQQSLASWVETYGAEAVEAAGLPAAAAQLQLAYGQVTDWIESEYLPAAAEADGVGREAYVAAVRDHLGTELDLEATYAWGWDTLRAELAELAEACAAIDPGRSVAEVVAAIDDDPAQQAPDVTAFVAAIQAQQDAAIAELSGTHFNIDERIRTIVVQWSPPGGSLAAQCIPASEDFSKPGVIQWPFFGKTDIPIAREITTAYHEGVPGHHLQCNYARLLEHPLSRLHTNWTWSPGLGEGWALYAERFMDELGALEPNAKVGFIVSKLLRTFRVVFDIGTHLGLPIPDDAPMGAGESWSFELGQQMMAATTFSPPDVIDSELQRYCSWPAQAIAYKVGEDRILAWRARWVDGGDEDLPSFHHRVLSIGAPGLDVAEQLMEQSA